MTLLPTTWAPIRPSSHVVPEYDKLCAGFSWEQARDNLAGLPGGRGLNIAHEAVDRHVTDGLGDTVAIRCISEGGEVSDISYARLRASTNRFANVLTDLGVGKRRPGHVVARSSARAVHRRPGDLEADGGLRPLVLVIRPGPIRERLRLSGAQVLVTTPALYRRKVAHIRAARPRACAGLRWLSRRKHHEPRGPDGRSVTRLRDPADRSGGHGPAAFHQRPGKPKGAVHVHEAVVAHHATSSYALDLRPGDIFWCTADPCWVTGTSYGIIAPLTHGATLVSYAGEFDAQAWYRLLAEQRVNAWYTAPTALRMLVKYGADLPHQFDLSALRHIASVGEALNPEVVAWGLEAYGLALHDNWWQPETGAIMVSNYRGTEVRPGSMGRPAPGIEAAVLVRGEDGRAAVKNGGVTLANTGQTGELALRPGWPSMFRGYLHEEERYASAEVSARILEQALYDLDGPVQRVCTAVSCVAFIAGT